MIHHRRRGNNGNNDINNEQRRNLFVTDYTPETRGRGVSYAIGVM